MYKYILRYRLNGYNGTTYGEIEILADEREEAVEQAHRWMMEAIGEEKAMPEDGRWAILKNSKDKVVKTMYGNAAMGYYWK